FGVSAGGPIRRDRTFVFGDYEGIRYSKGQTSVATVPSAAARGIAPDGSPTVARVCLGNPCVPNTHQPLTGKGSAFHPVPVTHIDRTVLRYLPFFPLPNAVTIGNGCRG